MQVPNRTPRKVKSIRLVAIYRGICLSALFAVMITQFNNCGQVGEPITSSSSDYQLKCDNDNCITPMPENLKITANLKDNQFPVKAGLADFNIGGDCNEGGYASNTIHWELYLDGTLVRHSAMLITGSTNAEANCVNGRFMIYVNLGSITEDPVNRSGLKISNSGNTRRPYDLYVQLFGHTIAKEKTAESSRIRIPLMVN